MDVGEVINFGIVIPVLGKAEDVSAWLKVAEESDVVVEAVADYSNAATSGILAKALTELQQRKPQITIIYTSGTWVYIPTYFRCKALHSCGFFILLVFTTPIGLWCQCYTH